MLRYVRKICTDEKESHVEEYFVITDGITVPPAYTHRFFTYRTARESNYRSNERTKHKSLHLHRVKKTSPHASENFF